MTKQNKPKRVKPEDEIIMPEDIQDDNPVDTDDFFDEEYFENPY